MPGDNNGPNVGVEIMKDLVRHLVLANENSETMREVLVEMRDLLDELNGNFDVVNRAMGILYDVRQSKKMLTVADFVAAWASADEEVHGEEDEPDQGDPVVGAER